MIRDEVRGEDLLDPRYLTNSQSLPQRGNRRLSPPIRVTSVDQSRDLIG